MWDRKKLREWDLKHFWHPYTQMRWYAKVKPPVFVRAKGNYLYDIDGKRYLDAVSSIWCNIWGHSNPKIVKGIIDEINKIQHTTTLGASNPNAILLSKKLSKLVGLPRIFLSEDGAEAIEVAIKMSFCYSKRAKNMKKVRFASVKYAYHGDTIGAMSVSGRTLFTQEYSELCFQAIQLPAVYCFRCKFNRSKEKGETKCSYECLEGAIRIIRKNRDILGAVFLEGGIQGAGGMIPYPPGYIKAIRDETKNLGILLVIDEVATGFGKTGKMFGHNWELGRSHKDKPDIVCLGKGLSGGYLPVAATLAQEEIYKVFLGELWEFKHFFHGHTFTGNPILAASAIENIELFEKNRFLFQRKLQPIIEHLGNKLKTLFDIDFVGDVRGRGLMWGIEIVRQGKESFPPQVLAGWRIALSMWKKGIFIRPLGDVLVVNLPLTIKKNEIDFLVEAMRESIVNSLRPVSRGTFSYK